MDESSTRAPGTDTHRGLSEGEVDPDPLRQFRIWFDEARAANLTRSDAMTLATASNHGKPSARIVILRAVDNGDFVFWTNADSRKGRELATSPWAALVFFWAEFDRQVRVEGQVLRCSAAASDDYFQRRSVESRLGEWVSHESDGVTNRKNLEHLLEHLKARFGDGEIPRPPSWYCYRVNAASIEFWQGRANSLHDRLIYRRVNGGSWVLERLGP